MNNSSPLPLLKALVPKIPLIGKTALYHLLGISDTSGQWDLRTELIVNIIRSFLEGPPESISRTQNRSIKDPGILGKMWISKITLPPGAEDDVRQALFQAIEELKNSSQAAGGYMKPELLSVDAEWTGYRAGATRSSPELRISEEQKYAELMREVTSPLTILYLHGGAYYLLDPASHRPTTSRLAKLTKGRCLSVRYRLAPQNPFPAAVLDALVSYLSLLFPQEGSLHAPVNPQHIVISGDSAGANLSLVLLQTLLQWKRQNRRVMWNGELRSVPLPAGVACNSAWMDISLSSPSCVTNWQYDYLPRRSVHYEPVIYPVCPVWPTSPPRRNLYAEDMMLSHPLVSPLIAEDWSDSCPLWLETGQEMLADENSFFAMRAAQQGVSVVFETFEAMPHCFAMVLPGTPPSRKCFDEWALFITEVVENPQYITTRGVKFAAKTLQESELNVMTLSSFTEEEVFKRLRDKISKMSRQRQDSLPKL